MGPNWDGHHDPFSLMSLNSNLSTQPHKKLCSFFSVPILGLQIIT